MRVPLLCGCLLISAFAAQITADENLPTILWRAPRPWSAQDWTCGAFGCGRAPVPPFHWVKEDLTGTEPKVSVRDAKSNSWSVKFGAEVIPECFVSRFVGAVGYVSEPTYCVHSGRIEGVHGKLRRARGFVHADGTFRDARFQLRDEKDLVYLDTPRWRWIDNPFLGSHELAGLKIVMMLLSNWDAKDAGDEGGNTSVFRVDNGGPPFLWYGISDWGASLGRWGGIMKRDQSDCAGYARDTPHLVERGASGELRWGFRGKHDEQLKQNVTVDDVRWLLPLLSRISEVDLRAALKASNATDRQAACWSAAIEKRIEELRAVAQ